MLGSKRSSSHSGYGQAAAVVSRFAGRLVPGRRRGQLAVTAIGLALLAPAIAGAASLVGPAVFGQVVPTGWIQAFDAEFRWSFNGQVPAQNAIRVQFDTTFIQAYGNPGAAAVVAALSTWANQSRNAVFIAGARNALPPPAANQYDLESVAAHEIGHAIGLYHPNEAEVPLIARNFDRAVPFAAPWLQNLNVLGTNQEVMHGQGAPGVNRRDLTIDDFAGLKYLYDANNKNAPVPPEPNVVGGVPGMGTLAFGPIGADNAVIDLAKRGTEIGQNIDVFAENFALLAVPPADEQPTLPADVDQKGGARIRKVCKGANGDLLAYADISFSLNPGGDGPGIIDGTPDNAVPGPADGKIVAGVDVVFNTDPNIRWFSPAVTVPAWPTWALWVSASLLLGSGALVARRLVARRLAPAV